MLKKHRTQYYLTAAALAAALFALFSIFPISGDDWYREGLGASLNSAGDLLRAVAQKWNTTNGRILGNVLSYTAGSRPIVRDILRTGITLSLFALLADISGLRRASGLLLCAAAAFALPREMFREVYPWAAGYFNYVPPVALTLGALALIPEVFEGKTVGAGKARCAALFILGFAAQLFVENTTFYVLCSAGILNALQLARHKRLSSALVLYFVGAFLGAALLLASPSYLNIFTSGGHYHTDASKGLSGLLLSARNNCGTVFRFLLADCPVLYCSITALLGAYIFRSMPKAIDIINFSAMLVCCGCLLLGTWSDIVTALICIVWFALSASEIIRRAGEARGKAIYFLLSSVCAAFPLLFVNPIGPRCLYISCIFLLAAALTLFAGLNICFRYAAPACVCLCTGVIVFYASVYYPLHKTYVLQCKLIEGAMAENASEVTVPTNEDHGWLWEANTEKMGYCYYYETPGDLKIAFAQLEEEK